MADDDERNFVWDTPPAADVPAPPGADPAVATPKKGGSTTVLGAAMLALGEILEPDKTDVVIEQQNDDDNGDDLPFDLDFGGLPPL
ncbi:MAG: hypothetical protein OEU32_07650 [Acidimicrobiia bacterium]|nr:hypothetical protein [Acidimicrobiia bacterium]